VETGIRKSASSTKKCKLLLTSKESIERNTDKAYKKALVEYPKQLHGLKKGKGVTRM
jgi:hypothetical protein